MALAASNVQPINVLAFRSLFGKRVQVNAMMSRYTTARVGGPADVLILIESADELSEAVRQLWNQSVPFTLLGGGSNVLVSDAGIRGVVLLNRTRMGKGIHFNEPAEPPTVWAESGVNIGALARQAAAHGLGGLEWAAGIPGTVGGAVIGNAGANGGDMADNLCVAKILHREKGVQEWPAEQLAYAYRSSQLKRQPGEAVILAAQLRLERSVPETIQAKMDEFNERRRSTQPPGASMGSMFKNPPEDHAGRLIEAAGLKGARIGDAEISWLHANFFINHGTATAQDIYSLIELAQQKVLNDFGVQLELEIERIGEWKQ